MGPQSKENSFTFQKNIFTKTNNLGLRNCRIKLQDRFKEAEKCEKAKSDRSNRSILSAISLSDTRKMFRSGAEKISKTFNELRTTLGTISQRFRISTKRRDLLEEGPVTPGYEITRQILGRTPTKLYSPFSIESPYNKPLTSKAP